MYQLLAIDRFDLHEYAICFATAFKLTDSKRLAAFRRSLVDYTEFGRRMLFKKITENEFCLCLAVRLDTSVKRYVNGLV
jgi:hypothetical protein